MLNLTFSPLPAVAPQLSPFILFNVRIGHMDLTKIGVKM